jgi:hypothetical protein
MKKTETIAEQNHRLKQLAIETAKKFNHKSFVFIGRGVIKKVQL